MPRGGRKSSAGGPHPHAHQQSPSATSSGLPAGSSPATTPFLPSPSRDGGPSAASSPSPTHVLSPTSTPQVMTLRLMYDVLRLNAPAMVERAAALLGVGVVVEEARAPAAMTGSPAARDELTGSEGRTSSTVRGGAEAPHGLSQRLVLAAVERLGGLLAAADVALRRGGGGGGGSKAEGGEKGCDVSISIRDMTLLARLLALYCLSTADRSAVLAGAGPVGGGLLGRASYGNSGRATPGPAMVMRAGGRGGRGGRGGGGGAIAVPASSGASASRFGDWASSRLSHDSTGSSARQLPDDQLAEQLLRPAVSLVARLSTYGVSPARGGDVEGRGEGEGRPPPPVGASAQEKEELRLSAIMLLSAVVYRFPEADFHYTTFLPMLFPDADVRGAGGGRHPLLAPLLWDPSDAVRGAASVLLVVLLHKMQRNLQYAEEPRRRQMSFVSLSVQGGGALMAIHEALHWALAAAPAARGHGRGRGGGKDGGGALPATSPASVPPAARVAKTPLLHVYAALLVVTPYDRCRNSLGVVMDTLELPELRRVLQTAGHGVSAEYVAGMNFLTNVFKNESLREHVAKYFTLDPPSSTALAPGASSNKASPASAGDTPRGGVLAMILAHARDRVEVWRCIVHISRLYPALIQQHFEQFVTVSSRVVRAFAEQEGVRAAVLADRTAAAGDGALAGRGGVGEEVGGSPEPGARSPSRQVGPQSSAEASRVRPPAAVHVDPTRTPPPPSSSSSVVAAPTSTSPSTSTSPATATPPVASEAVAECLRAWLHFMGYVWKAFDNNPEDPAQRPERQADRATTAQKRVIFTEIIRPAMSIPGVGGEVGVTTLRSLAQLGEDFLRDPDCVSESVRGSLVDYVTASLGDWSEKVRAEALSTIGVWAWQYPSMDAYGPQFVNIAVDAFSHDTDPQARAKAVFALANLTCRLGDSTSAIRDSPEHVRLLCDTAVFAVADSDPIVQGHAVRIMCHLLQVLEFAELTEELAPSATLVSMHMTTRPLRTVTVAGVGYGGAALPTTDGLEDLALGAGVLREADPISQPSLSPPPPPATAESLVECVVEGFLRILLFMLSSTHLDAKCRWNAAYSMGEALRRDEVFEAEPGYAMDCVYALMTAVVRDRFFKVRTQAATALAKVCASCLAGSYSDEDMSAQVMRALCVALGNSRSTESFTQYKEQGALHSALRASIEKLMTMATPTKELDRVLAEFRPLLQEENLI